MKTPTRPALTAMIRIGDFFFAYRSYLFPLVFIPLAIVAAPDFPFGGERTNLVLDILGILVALAGLSLRALVVGLVYIKRGGKGGKVHADDLVQEGIFAHSRNPLYLGNILLVAGLGLVHGSLWLCIGGIPFIIFAYLCIVAAEEAFL
ncbi:MAG: methyltransferase family protein, partial [Myxococcota bacterium]